MCNIPSLFAGVSPTDAIAASAAIVALLAMGATFWQAKLARDHNRLSVRPHLDIVFSAYPEQNIVIRIQNSGLGPAIVRSLHVSFDGLEYSSPTAAMAPALRKIVDAADQKMNWTLLGPNSPIRPDASIALVEFTKSGSSIPCFNAALAFAKRMAVRIEYESMYREPYTLKDTFANY